MSRNKSFYKLGKMLGMSTQDITNVLKNETIPVEHASLEVGPTPYWCAFYGTISINDF